MFFEKKCQSLIIQRKIKGIYFKTQNVYRMKLLGKERRLIKAS